MCRSCIFGKLKIILRWRIWLRMNNNHYFFCCRPRLRCRCTFYVIKFKDLEDYVDMVGISAVWMLSELLLILLSQHCWLFKAPNGSVPNGRGKWTIHFNTCHVIWHQYAACSTAMFSTRALLWSHYTKGYKSAGEANAGVSSFLGLRVLL